MTTAPDLPTNVAVFGGGRMGAGIAHAFLVKGSTVTLVESSADFAAAAEERVAASIAKAVEKGVVTGGAPEILQRLVVTTDRAAIGDAELVVEAVPEDLDMKAGVLRAAAGLAPGAVLATNTSSLSIDALAERLPDPSRVLGLHFFNPVPTSDLVEIVVGAGTAPDVVARAQGWVAALGKTAITVADSPGFASSRLGVAIALEAMRMVEDGVGSAADIDTAMTLGYRHPTGPLRTTDLVGLDVRLAIAEHLAAEIGPRFEPPAILREMVAAGKLGRKTGEGFYQW